MSQCGVGWCCAVTDGWTTETNCVSWVYIPTKRQHTYTHIYEKKKSFCGLVAWTPVKI